MYIIAGLGNPTQQYDHTRHNIGFDTITYLADRYHITMNTKKFQAICGTGVIEGQKVLLLKPQTYMNLSGESVGEAARFYKVPADHVLVISDDVSLPVGKLRIRKSGSAGGHNGLKSIIASLGTDHFSRIRIGIGAKPNPQYDLAAWVLGKLPAADRKAMTDRYPDIEEACKLLMDDNLQYAQNKYNH